MAQPVVIAPAPTPIAPVGPKRDDNQIIPADMSQLSILGMTPKVRRSARVPLSESFMSSLHSLGANVTRTILTMLGIIIGVGAVIALLAYGNGVVAKALANLERNGTNLVTLQGANQNAVGNVPTGLQSQTLTLSDAAALSDPANCPDCAAVSPEVGTGGPITAGRTRTFAETKGVSPSYSEVHSYNVVSGTFIADTDVAGNATVVDLGATVAQNLFPNGDAVGQTIRIRSESFKVVGVMEAKGGSGFGSLDNEVFVPVTTAIARLTGGRGQQATTTSGKVVQTIYVKATSPDTVDAAIDEVNSTLAAQHKVKSGIPDWQVINQQDQLQAAQDTQKTYQIFLLVIASISLLVGGIGIMNIMLVSVTERTREIGIRKAIGAKNADILTQFITEAVLMSLIGALMGVAFGLLSSYLVGRFYQQTIVSVQSIFIAVAFAVATGLFFGVYPAQRAASLKPIDALRYE